MSHAATFLCPVSAEVRPASGRVVASVDTAAFVISGEARRWFGLAVGSLVIAGLLSLSVVVGRLPGLAELIGDPLFFKRCLVVHVDLALVVWFYALLAGLAALRSVDTGRVGGFAFGLAVGGVGAMLVGALMRGAQPVLANYVPVIDHPLFLGGIAAFFVGVLLFLLATLGNSAPAHAGGPASDAAAGLQAAAITVLLAGATWVSTRAALPDGLDAWTRFEFSAWGAGHVLQVANAAAMLAVWLWLLARATGRPVLSAGAARIVFSLLVAPHFAMPLLTLRGALDPLYHSGATLLMRWGIFPVVLAVLALGVRHLRKHGISTRDALAPVARAGFVASAALTLLGIVLGACIRGSTTLVPAHYHASLGGVTVALMTAAYLVCDAIARGGLAAAVVRSARRQVTLFGVGQTVFALGFAIGGAYGLGRKAYAGEQHVRSAGELVGLGVMGVGGLVATAAGLWFLFLVLREMRGWWAHRATTPESLPQTTP
jgi:cytochrome c oxidase subunit 1